MLCGVLVSVVVQCVSMLAQQGCGNTVLVLRKRSSSRVDLVVWWQAAPGFCLAECCSKTDNPNLSQQHSFQVQFLV